MAKTQFFRVLKFSTRPISLSPSPQLAHLILLLLLLLLLLPLNSFAQQHQPDLKWLTLKTPHFSVHFPKEFEATGRKVAQICEDVYEPISKSLNYYPHRTQVVVHTRSDLANGFVVQLPWRMELFITEPQDNLIGSRESWLRVLITHEFTHVVQARKTKGLSRLSYPFFGELNSFWHNATPNWYVEGFATLNETRYTHGGRGRNAFHRMKQLAPLQNRVQWSLANSNFPSRKRLPADINYVSGYYLSQHISKKFGNDAWAEIADSYFDNPLLGFGNAVKKVTGSKPEALYDEMLAKTKNIPSARVLPVSPSRIWRNATVPENQLTPRWISNNQVVYYRAGFDDLPEIASFEQDGTSSRILERALFGTDNVLDAGKRYIVWAETNQHIRYSATELTDLMLYDRQQRSLHALTSRGRVYSPDLSPNEKQIVAIQTNLPYNQLVTVSTKTGEIRVLLHIENTALLNPRWSPDGNKISFAIKDSTGKQDISVLDVKTGNCRLLFPADDSHENSPCWTPDGKYLLYSSDRSGIFNIWAIEIETGKRWMVTNERTGAFAPDVSPDGKQLAFTIYTEKGFLIASIAFDEQKWIEESTLSAE
ncbi:MAG: TolB family protein, partial [bacterium]